MASCQLLAKYSAKEAANGHAKEPEGKTGGHGSSRQHSRRGCWITASAEAAHSGVPEKGKGVEQSSSSLF